MIKCVNYPLISVIIPSFNQGQFIEETLISVIGQQYPNLEILVIDGGSTDNTVEVLKKYTDKISYWHSKKDKGQADAINQGIHLSSGDVICWLNSDDMFMPGTLLDVGKRFQSYTSECYFVYGAAVNIKNGDQIVSRNQIPTSFDASKLTYFDYIVQPSTFWTRKLFQKVGDLNDKYDYVLDWEWFIRASKIVEFEYIPKIYSVYRIHPSHKTGNGGAKRRKEITEVVEKYSSDYWSNVFREINTKYDDIEKTLNVLSGLKIRGTSLILLFLFPRIMFLVKTKKDFLCAFYMLS